MPKADSGVSISYAHGGSPRSDTPRPGANDDRPGASAASGNDAGVDAPSEEQSRKLQEFDAMRGRPMLAQRQHDDGQSGNAKPSEGAKKAKLDGAQSSEPRQKICADVSGAGDPPCVLVKGGEKLSDDDKKAIAKAYHDFIVKNDGADISQHGAVTYGFSDEDTAKVRVASQFIGANLPEGWRNTRIHAGPGGEVGLPSGQAGRTDWQKLAGDPPEETYIIKINMDWGDHRTNPSGLARTMIHESMHRRDNGGWIFGHNDAHRQLDANARAKLQEYGLGGGGCLPVGGGFWGLIPHDYPGCSK
ncbi:MAG: hypothetical protein AAF543_07910 [Pseudomonadota bacterium]